MAASTSDLWIIVAFNPTFLIPAMSLVGALLAGAVIIALIRRRVRRGDSRPDPATELTRYRSLYEQGAISEAEYRSLRALLGGELRRSAPIKNVSPPTDPTNAIQTTPDASPGRDVLTTPSDGIRPAE